MTAVAVWACPKLILYEIVFELFLVKPLKHLGEGATRDGFGHLSLHPVASSSTHGSCRLVVGSLFPSPEAMWSGTLAVIQGRLSSLRPGLQNEFKAS